MPPAVAGWSPAPWAAGEVWGLILTNSRGNICDAEKCFLCLSSKHYLGPVVLGNGCPPRDKEPGLKKLIAEWAGVAPAGT